MPSLDATQWLLHAGVLGSGVLSGVYFIFSFCVMKSLDAQAATSAIATMNAINVIIVNPFFSLFFFGAPIVCAALLGLSVKEGVGSSLDTKLTTAGALVLLIGELLLTGVVHIPKNNALSVYKPGQASDAAVWADYYTSWTAWNHVRGLASMVTVACLSYALQERAARLAVLKPSSMH